MTLLFLTSLIITITVPLTKLVTSNFFQVFWFASLITCLVSFKLLFFPSKHNYKSIKIDITTQNDIKDWKTYLNEVVGLYCYPAAISCIASNKVSTYAFIYMVIIILYIHTKLNKYNNRYSKIRKKFFINRTKDEKIYMKVVFNRLLNLRAMFSECWLFTIGFLSLLLLLIYGDQIKQLLK